jgi:alkylation response protein AidB-like acyl-CoA dehydrogenase
VRHKEAWRHLPDLLDDRDDAALLAHVRACAHCQRQLFLLGRVDRMLHDGAALRRSARRWPSTRRLVAAAAAVAATVAAILALLLPQQARTHGFVLRTASGRVVGEARMGNPDAGNVSLALTARDLPVDHGDMYVLWAGAGRSSMQVGRFMVDRTGGCHVRFNLPATHAWHRLWVTEPGRTLPVVAST